MFTNNTMYIDLHLKYSILVRLVLVECQSLLIVHCVEIDVLEPFEQDFLDSTITFRQQLMRAAISLNLKNTISDLIKRNSIKHLKFYYFYLNYFDQSILTKRMLHRQVHLNALANDSHMRFSIDNIGCFPKIHDQNTLFLKKVCY